MSESNRRSYVKRKGEFNEVTPEDLRARISTEIAKQAELRGKLKVDATDEVSKQALKDSVNFNVRAYRRMRELGHPCKPVAEATPTTEGN